MLNKMYVYVYMSLGIGVDMVRWGINEFGRKVEFSFLVIKKVLFSII